jgi:hypothetical protein
LCRYLLPWRRAKAKKFRRPVRSGSVCGAGDAWAHGFGRRKGACRSRSPPHGRRRCMLLCILGALYLANAAQKGQSGAGHNRQSHRVASSVGNLGGIPAAIENERFLQPRRAGKNKIVRISRALRIWRSNYPHRVNPAGVWGTLPGLSRYFPRERHAGRKARNPEETECGNRNQLARASSRCGGRSRSGIRSVGLAAFALTV